jgi:hypothetical protein
MKTSIKQPALLILNRAALEELHKLALVNTLPLSKVNYREAQQLITLDALKRYFEQYGLQAPFEIELTDV